MRTDPRIAWSSAKLPGECSMVSRFGPTVPSGNKHLQAQSNNGPPGTAYILTYNDDCINPVCSGLVMSFVVDRYRAEKNSLGGIRYLDWVSSTHMWLAPCLFTH